jgi:HlyD family secretion protein
VVLVAAAVGVGYVRLRKKDGPAVNVETIRKQNLEAIVSASGKIQAKRSVNISADRMGRVVRLAVNEGDRVKAGQFLLQIDPRTLRTVVQRGEANLEAQRTRLQSSRVAVENANVSLAQAREALKRQQDLWKSQLTTREQLDQAEHSVALREGELKQRVSEVATAEQQIRSGAADLASAEHDLSLVTVESPIDGIVVRRNIEEGETAVMGTMNQPGTVLLTIADMSVVEAEIEVDETDIPNVALAQPAKVTIDAMPGKTFTGRVTEIGNSPIQTSTVQSTSARAATNFKVVVTLEDQVVDVRPGFTCTADITTATRTGVISVPIQALTVREVLFDAAGGVVHEPNGAKRASGSGVETNVSAAEPKPGQTRKETEGVFVVREAKAFFVPVKTGIAGDKYFEVLSGLNPGDRVITGPFSSVRDLVDGGAVTLEDPAKK